MPVCVILFSKGEGTVKNLQLELEKLISTAKGEHILIHSCCAPCSSYVIEYLSDYYKISLFYYNPNILPEEEYYKRLAEQKRLVESLPLDEPIKIYEKDYNPEEFLSVIKGYENEPEGGKRCEICYRLRLEETARLAKEIGADYFTSTLSISPYKNANLLEEIAVEMAEKYGVKRLPADFKKRGGYQRSIQLSKEHDLYRQDWCGCPFSYKESLERRKERES